MVSKPKLGFKAQKRMFYKCLHLGITKILERLKNESILNYIITKHLP